MTASASDAGRRVLPGVQLLRGITALLVVASHANIMMRYPRYFSHSPFAFHDAGVFGVTVFFVISGFIIMLVSLDADLTPRLGRTDYARRRFIRIVPFLWLCVLGYNVLSWGGTGVLDWPSMLRALFVWPVGELKPNVVWSLRHEAMFYALFALCMLGARRTPWPMIVWFTAPLWYGGLAVLTGGRSVPRDPLLAEFFHIVLEGGDSGANLQIGVGVLLGWLTLRGHRLMRWTPPGGLATPLIALLGVVVVAEVTALPVGLGRWVAWTALAAISAWLGIVAASESGILRRVGMVLGNASFSIYLTHNGVVLTIFELLRPLRGAIAPPVFFLLTATVATLIGIAIHYLVEVPVIGRLAKGRWVAPWMRRGTERRT